MEYVDINTLGHNRKQNQVLVNGTVCRGKNHMRRSKRMTDVQSTKIDGKIIVYVYHYGAIR